MEQIYIDDAIDLFQRDSGKTHLFVNIRGANGSGKSTIPITMKESDPFTFEIVREDKVLDRMKVIATVFPSYNFLAVGSYKRKCGGLDTVKSKEQIRELINLFWHFDLDILAEGVLPSTVYQYYRDIFVEANTPKTREVIIYNIIPSFQTCLNRVYARNGGKKIREDLVFNKYRQIARNVDRFKSDFISEKFDNTGIRREQTPVWFMENIAQYRR